MIKIILNLFITLERTDISTIISPSNLWVWYLFSFIGFFRWGGGTQPNLYLPDRNSYSLKKKKGQLNWDLIDIPKKPARI